MTTFLSANCDLDLRKKVVQIYEIKRQFKTEKKEKYAFFCTTNNKQVISGQQTIEVEGLKKSIQIKQNDKARKEIKPP